MELHLRLLRYVVDVDNNLSPEAYNRVFLGSPINESFFHEYDAKTNKFSDTYTSYIFQLAKDYFNEFRRAPSDDLIAQEISEHDGIDLMQKRAMRQILHQVRQYDAKASDLPKIIAKMVEEYRNVRETYILQKAVKIREGDATDGRGESGVDASIRYVIEQMTALQAKQTSRSAGGVTTATEFADTVIEKMKHAPELVTPVAYYGFSRWDKYSGGLYAGTVSAFGAGLSVGKSWFLHDTSLTNAKDLGKNVIIWNLEMLEDQIAMRIICRQTGIPLNKLKRGFENLSPQEQDRFVAAQEGIRDMGDRLLFLDRRRCQNLSQVRAEQIQHFGNRQVHLLMCDYIDKVSPSRTRYNEGHEKMAIVSAEFKDYALEHNLAGLTATQGNRQANKKKDKAGDAKSDPTVDDLSYLQFAKDFDTIIMLTEDANNPYEAPDPDDDEEGTPGIINARFVRGRNHGKQRGEPFRMSVEFSTGKIAQASDFARSKITEAYRRVA